MTFSGDQQVQRSVFGFSFCAGRVGQLRFSLRKDIDPSSYGHCECEELRGQPRSGEDVILIAKKFMASPEPYKVVVLLSAEQCATLRKSICQPSGVASRRPISDKVTSNIKGKVPVLLRNQILHPDAAAYLQNWAGSTLEHLPRPRAYSVLNHRYDQDPEVGGQTVPWQPKVRERHIDLTLLDDEDRQSDSDDRGDDLQPIMDD